MKKGLVKGMEGIVATESSICKIDGKKGKLSYRGYSILDLARYSSFEEVIYLLWYGDLPNKSSLIGFKKSINKNLNLIPQLKKFIEGLPRKVVPVTALRTAVSLLAIYDKDTEDISKKSGILRLANKLGIYWIHAIKNAVHIISAI